jgi:hypothetical protein
MIAFHAMDYVLIA